MKKNEKEKMKKKGEGARSSLAQPTRQPIYPSPLTFLQPASSLELPILSPAPSHLSLSLSFSTTAPPPPRSVSCFPLSSRCCRPAPIGGTWPQPAQAAARLGVGRAATSPVGAGEHVCTGELRLLVPLPLSCW